MVVVRDRLQEGVNGTEGTVLAGGSPEAASTTLQEPLALQQKEQTSPNLFQTTGTPMAFSSPFTPPQLVADANAAEDPTTFQTLNAPTGGPTTTAAQQTGAAPTAQTGTNGTNGTSQADQTIEEQIAQRAATPGLPEGTQFTPVDQQVQEGEVETAVTVSPTGQQVQAQTITGPEQVDAAQVDAVTIPEQDIPEVDAVEGTVSSEAQVTAAVGTESEEFRQSIEEERQRLIDFPVDPNATVAEQYTQLTAGVEDGQTPPWAAAAVRAAEARLGARGFGASTLAGEAITAAILQAALPIASQDAQVFQSLQEQKFNSTAALGVLRSTHIANLDLANLNNRQQAAVENARAFLSMDLANADREQQAAVVNSQNRMQTLLSNQAAENAAMQFNAQSENEINTFFAQLSQNAKQFNAAQTQSAQEFNANQRNQRELFNAQQEQLVQRSNVDYLRRINTANNANQNQANLVNSQNLLNISNTAIANQITLFRDQASYNFQASENAQERNLRRAIAELQANTNLAIQGRDQQFQLGQALGGLAGDIIGGLLD